MTFSDLFGLAQQALFEGVVQPLLFHLGLAGLIEDAFDATGWLLVGLVQLGVMIVVIAPLERWRPVEPTIDWRAVRADIVYTLVHRLGLFRVAMFFAIEPLWLALFGWFAVEGVPRWQLDAALAAAWPAVGGSALVAFAVYLLIFDFADYLIHRAQHRYAWWWALHALHHSQRQMTMWTDNRNHLLDDILRDSLLVLLAHAIGMPPGQFVAVVAVTHLLENFSHANVRLSFGWLGERLLVSPRFHRVHHAIGIGHEADGPGTIGGRNFAVLFPVWDRLFGTADHASPPGATGVRDQLPDHGARDYGHGFLAQQWLGVKRLFGRA